MKYLAFSDTGIDYYHFCVINVCMRISTLDYNLPAVKKVETDKTKRYCLYARKSTESEERQVMSIDSQIKEMLDLADREKLDVVNIKREAHSAKETNMRPVFNEIIEGIKLGKYNSILTWAPDRVSRNAGDLGRVVDLMDAGKLLEIKTHSQTFTNNPNEKFLLMILGSQAKLENENRISSILRGKRTKTEMGLCITTPPLGYLFSDKPGHFNVDPVRAPIIKQIFEKMGGEKWSGGKIYKWLKEEVKFKTRGDKFLHESAIFKILNNTFYYGEFESPRGSGDWYKGQHTPIITKELFGKAQTQSKRGKRNPKRHSFAFNKLLLCGYCSSFINAQEKWKYFKNGTTRKYIYYACGRGKDKFCKNEYIREEELIVEICNLLDNLDISKLGMQEELQEQITRFKLLQKSLNSNEIILMLDYVKYILQSGTIAEKRELMENFRNKIIYKDKKLTLI